MVENGSITDSHQFSYDSEGQLLSGANLVSKVHFSYDAAERIIQEQQDNTNTNK